MKIKKQIELKALSTFVKKMLEEHASFLVIVLGGFCFLLSNIILKEIFSPADYGFYSMIVTFISAIYIYGLLGFESVLMRFSYQISRNVVNVSTTQWIYVVVISTLTSFGSFFWFKSCFQDQITISYLLLFFTFFCSIISLFLFSIFRLNSDFLSSQLVANGWRIFLLAFSSVFFVFKSSNLAYFITIFFFVFVLIIVLLSVRLFSRISFDLTNRMSPKEIFTSFFYFFLSITIVSILLFGDRFIIENKFGIEVFGDYFYLTNLVLSPFTIFQNYVGFKQLVRFKKHFSVNLFLKINRKVFFLSIALSVAIGLFLFVLSFFEFLSFNFSNYISSIVLLFLLGIIRLYSAVTTAAYEARTSIKTLKNTNWTLITSIVLAGAFIIYLCSSLNQIIIGFIVAWTIRNITLRQYLLRQIKKQTK